METNKFLSENINDAILLSQYDMRGYVHPLGFRMNGIEAKGLSYLPVNLIQFSAGWGKKDDSGNKLEPTIAPDLLFYYNEENLTYEKILALCQKFVSECNRYQKEAIQFLLKDVLNKTAELKAEAESKNERTAYIRPLDQSNNWGKIMLGLMEAFDVKVDEPVAIITN